MSVAQYVVMAVWQLDHGTNSCRSAGSIIGRDAKLPDATLSHADNAESESAAARNKAMWRSSLTQHARSVAQDDGMAAWRLDHVTNSCRTAGITVRHDAKLPHATLSHAHHAESE